MKDLLEPPVPHAFAVNSLSLLVSVCFFFPFAGSLSDRYGRRKCMTIGGVGLGTVGPLLLAAIRKYRTPAVAVSSQCVLGVFLSLWGAPMCAWLYESFDAQARLTSVAIGYNLAQALAGGSVPYWATLFVDKNIPPGILLTVLSVLSLAGLWLGGGGREKRDQTEEAVEMTKTTDNEVI